MSSVSRHLYIDHAAFRCKGIDETVGGDDSVESPPVRPRFNPLVQGFDYSSFHKLNPEFIPRTTHLDPEVKTGLDHDSIETKNHKGFTWVEGGDPDRCTKKRHMVISHKSRTALWIVSCLRCNKVVGYHIMKHSEGRRIGRYYS